MTEKKYDAILVGGTGFIGQALLHELSKNGKRVLNLGRNGAVTSEADFSPIDAKDKESFRTVFSKVPLVYILLGQTHASFQEEEEMRILQNIVEIIREFPPEKVIYTSSVLVYGECSKPAEEIQNVHPIEKYSQFKSRAESFLQANLSSAAILIGIARLGNVYGDVKNKGFINFLIQKLLTKNDSLLELNGDGEQKRDYVFLDDVAKALYIFGEKLKKNDTVNIATGKSTSLKELVRSVEEVTDKKIEYTINGKQLEEVKNIFVSVEKLKNDYGFLAHASLSEGLKKTIERYRQNTQS